jgi:hypothetical protein
MKLNVLHETTTIGAIAFKPNMLGKIDSVEVSRPKGHIRWYLAFADDDAVDGLMEESGNSTKPVKTQFGSQTSRPKKLVWQPEETQGNKLTNKSLYVPSGTREAKPYRQSKVTFSGQSEGHDEHILK